jgi:hypothetical protein
MVHQLLELTGRRQRPPQRVEFETRRCSRQGPQQARDHGKVCRAVVGNVSRKIDVMVDCDVEQGEMVVQRGSRRFADLGHYCTDVETGGPVDRAAAYGQRRRCVPPLL